MLNAQGLEDLGQIRAFLAGMQALGFEAPTRPRGCLGLDRR